MLALSCTAATTAPRGPCPSTSTHGKRGQWHGAGGWSCTRDGVTAHVWVELDDGRVLDAREWIELLASGSAAGVGASIYVDRQG